MAKRRLDHLLNELYPQKSKTECQRLISAGAVLVEGEVVSKPGVLIDETAVIALSDTRDNANVSRYVSRAGDKLAHALDQYKLDVARFVALDAGLSTGGFTDCLLQHGAARVYGVDVGTAQVNSKISSDPRVVVMEQTDLRSLEQLPERVDLITLDLSFISLTKVIPVLERFAKAGAYLVTLIKPQFEVGRENVGKGGIVRDEKLYPKVFETVISAAKAAGWEAVGDVVESPIQGGSGNREFFACFRRR